MTATQHSDNSSPENFTTWLEVMHALANRIKDVFSLNNARSSPHLIDKLANSDYKKYEK